MSPKFEKRLLQIIVVIVCAIPIIVGGSGAFFGANLLSNYSNVNLDSHFRYLSGLLLGIGLVFLYLVPNLEKHSAQFRLLTFIIVIGGLCRLSGLFLFGIPNAGMIGGLLIELVLVPVFYLWQQRIAKRFAMGLNTSTNTTAA